MQWQNEYTVLCLRYWEMRIVKAMTEKLLYHLSLNFKPLKYPKGLIRFEALKRPKRYRDIDIDIDIPHSRVGMYISKWN